MRQNAHQATFPDGIEDRLAHLKMVGAMPLPRTSQTVVNVSATAQSAAIAAPASALPSPDETIRKMVEARQRSAGTTQPALPESVPAESVPMAFQRREAVTVDAEYEEADE
jgi:hypothetical protein